MRLAGSTIRGVALTAALAAIFCGNLLPAEAQSGRKPPEKARKERPDGERPKPGDPPETQAPAGPPPKPLTKEELADAVTLSTNVVNVETVVYEKKSGGILQGMKQGNFEIYEDGVKQEITNFAPSQGPMTIVVLLEYSRRIENGWITKEEVVEPLYVLGSRFVKPDDNVAIVAFDTRPFVVQDFTGDVKLLNRSVEFLLRNNPAFSESNIYDALNFVLQGGKSDGIDLRNGETSRGAEYAGLKVVEGRSAVILVSLGYDTFSKLNYDQIRQVIGATGVPIYTIGVGNLFYKSNEHRLGAEQRLSWQQAFLALRTFSRISGGRYFPVTFSSELPSTIESITNLMRNQYSLGYTPSNQRRAGKTRKIEVKIDIDGDGIYGEKEEEKNYVIQHRETYIEPNDNPRK
ncbi:MAG: VWA domain-containing protein [Acidobacteria bacterium]|nr:VWA domain-containing protein [Acidobacteriota bacterium]